MNLNIGLSCSGYNMLGLRCQFLSALRKRENLPPFHLGTIRVCLIRLASHEHTSGIRMSSFTIDCQLQLCNFY